MAKIDLDKLEAKVQAKTGYIWLVYKDLVMELRLARKIIELARGEGPCLMVNEEELDNAIAEYDRL